MYNGYQIWDAFFVSLGTNLCKITWCWSRASQLSPIAFSVVFSLTGKCASQKPCRILFYKNKYHPLLFTYSTDHTAWWRTTTNCSNNQKVCDNLSGWPTLGVLKLMLSWMMVHPRPLMSLLLKPPYWSSFKKKVCFKILEFWRHDNKLCCQKSKNTLFPKWVFWVLFLNAWQFRRESVGFKLRKKRDFFNHLNLA